jgi:hypothetical protein
VIDGGVACVPFRKLFYSDHKVYILNEAGRLRHVCLAR